MRNLYISIDNHLGTHASDAGATPENFAHVLAELKPKRMTVFAVGHDGYAQFPSKILPAHPSASKDLLAMWRQVCRTHGVEFFVYISTLRNIFLEQTRPEFLRRHSNGQAAAVIDHNAPFFEEILRPLLLEINATYDPDGYFLDGDFWTLHDSWSPVSVQMFESETGRHAPQDYQDPLYPAFRAWQFTSYNRYISKIDQLFQKSDRPRSWTVNGAYTLRDGRALPPSLDRAAIDITCFYGQVDAFFEAVYMQSRKIHSDTIMPKFVQPEGSYRIQKKSSSQVMQDLALALTFGSVPHMYFPASADGSIQIDDAKSLIETYDDFFAEHLALARPSRTVPGGDVVILHDSLPLVQRRYYAPLRGAALCLATLHEGFRILDSHSPLDSFHGASIILIPPTEQLSDAALSQLRALLRAGFSALVPRHLQTAIAAAPATASSRLGTLLRKGVSALAPRRQQKPTAAQQRANIDAPPDSPRPAGSIVGYDGDPFTDFSETLSRNTRTWLRAQLDALRKRPPIYTIQGPEHLFSRIYTSENGLDIHLLNVGHGSGTLGRRAFAQRVPRIRAVEIQIGMHHADVQMRVHPPAVFKETVAIPTGFALHLQDIAEHAFVSITTGREAS